MIHLETDRIVLREWKDEDLEPFARMNADPLVMEYMPRSLDEKASARLVKRFQKHFQEYGYGLYALELKADKEFMGFVGLENVRVDLPFAPAVEIAWRLDYGFWGKGYATEAARAVMEHAFGSLGLEEIVAFTVYDHERSLHVIQKLGMVRDEKGDFDYPTLPKGHPLGRFVLYRKNIKDFSL